MRLFRLTAIRRVPLRAHVSISKLAIVQCRMALSTAASHLTPRPPKEAPLRELTADERKEGRTVGSHATSPSGRKVRIYRPLRAATQQTEEPTKWAIEFDRGAQSKWVNPLMGWTSGSDTMAQLDGKLKFDTRQEAIDYCLSNGIEYEILEPTEHRKKPKSYADNFKYRKN